MLNEDIIKKLGFIRVYTFTIMNSYTYDLGRGRILSIGNIGTPNEMLFICQIENKYNITDIITLHNYDYDSYLTEDKLVSYIEALKA